MWEITYNYLVSCSVHIGHSIKNSSPFCSWMVLAKRQDILLINLYKWTFMMQFGIGVFETAVLSRTPVWFVTLDPIKSSIVRVCAMSCGEFNVTAGWISGMLSNYFMICLSWAKNRIRPAYVRPALQKRLADIYDHWMISRITWPRAVFLCGVQKSFRVARESIKARIPCVSIADTLGGHQALSLAVPGNDDTMDSVYFHNFLAARTILRKKYSQVFSWYYNVRNSNRLGEFQKWFALMSTARKKQEKPLNYLLWNNNTAFSARSFRNTFGQPNLASTGSLLNLIIGTTRINSAKRGYQEPCEYYEQQELNIEVPTYKEIIYDFVKRHKLYTSLIRLSFFSEVGNTFRSGLRKVLRKFRPWRRPRGLSIGIAGRRNRTFLSRKHEFFDLLTPTINLVGSIFKAPRTRLPKEIVSRRALKIKIDHLMNFGPFRFKAYSILSTFLLTLAMFTRVTASKASYYLDQLNYPLKTRYFRRIKRELKSLYPWKKHYIPNRKLKIYGKFYKMLENTKTITSYRNFKSMQSEPKKRLESRGFFSNIYYLFLTRLAFMGAAHRSRGTDNVFFIKKPLHQRFSSVAIEKNSIYRKYFLRNVRSRDRSLRSLLHLRNTTTLASRVYRILPRFLRKVEEEKKKSKDLVFKLKKTVNKRSRLFKKFQFNSWIFYSLPLPQPYWGSPLYYLPRTKRLLTTYAYYERWFSRKISYPLLRESSSLVRFGELKTNV